MGFPNYCDVTWGSLLLKSPATRLFAQLLIQANNKENIKAPHYLWLWPVVSQRPVLRKTLHFMKSSFHSTVIATGMMTLSNGNIFRVTGHLCGEFPAQRPVTQSFDVVFFYLRLNKRLSKQSLDWWFETLSHPLWRHCNGVGCPGTSRQKPWHFHIRTT